MRYRFEFRPYQRPFKRPLQTSHGVWRVREGILLRLTDEKGDWGWGEIAPISWLGSESFEAALAFCRQSPALLSQADILAISDEFPACQFGFESAWEMLELSVTSPQNPDQNYSGLLPAGEASLQEWLTLWQQGYRTFKWKIGVEAVEKEQEIFQRLTQAMASQKETAFLRLDANGGLTQKSAYEWLKLCDSLTENDLKSLQIEFLEQPLPVTEFDNLLKLSQQFLTPIALDESVATLSQMQTCYQQGWRGIFVIKPSLAGFPSQLRKFCTIYEIDAVFSSVFETKIGQDAALKLATQLSTKNRALGFGVNHWFENQENWIESLWLT